MSAANVNPCDFLQGLLQEAGGVGGVQKNQVELLAGLQVAHGIAVYHPGPIRKAAGLQILPDGLEGILAPLYEHSALRPPAQGLDAQLAGAGEEVQDPAPLNIELDDGEQSLLDLPRGGAGLQALQLL